MGSRIDAMKCPLISDFMIFADDAKLAAQASLLLAQPRCYLPVCDGPRLQRPDADAEVIRRHNASARAKTRVAVMAGLSDESFGAMSVSLSRHRKMSCLRVFDQDDLNRLPVIKPRINKPLEWGRDRIGIGLLKALYDRCAIVFGDDPSPNEGVPSNSGHFVVCEDGEELSQVIAANYAFALNAGLILIPEVDKELATSLLEHFYTISDSGSPRSPAQAREYLT